MSRIYAIGDVHGCFDALRYVIDRVVADAGEHGISRPKVVFLGDYVDRGPASKDVLDLLSCGDLDEVMEPVYLLGNHEASMLDALEGNVSEQWLHVGGADCLESYGVSLRKGWAEFMRDFRAAVPQSHLRFLKSLALTHISGPWLFSHAGIDPFKSLEKQTREALLFGNHRFLAWPEPIAGNVRVVHGHWRERENRVAILRHRVGVDTGSGFPGGRLSAVALDEDGAGVRVLNEP